MLIRLRVALSSGLTQKLNRCLSQGGRDKRNKIVYLVQKIGVIVNPCQHQTNHTILTTREAIIRISIRTERIISGAAEE